MILGGRAFLMSEVPLYRYSPHADHQAVIADLIKPLLDAPPLAMDYEFFTDDLLVRIHFIIVMMRWTGLAPWIFEFPFPGCLTALEPPPQTPNPEAGAGDRTGT